MNAQHVERCSSCSRPRGDAESKKRPVRFCWLEHDEACRAAELWLLRGVRGVLELARKMISTPRGTPEHLAAELELVRAIAAVDTQTPPALRPEPLSTPES